MRLPAALVVALAACWAAAPALAQAGPAGRASRGLGSEGGSIASTGGPGGARQLAAAVAAAQPEWSLGGLEADGIVGSPADHDHPLLSMLRRRYALAAAEPAALTRGARRLQQDAPPPPTPPPPMPPPPTPPSPPPPAPPPPPFCDCVQFPDLQLLSTSAPRACP